MTYVSKFHTDVSKKIYEAFKGFEYNIFSIILKYCNCTEDCVKFAENLGYPNRISLLDDIDVAKSNLKSVLYMFSLNNGTIGILVETIIKCSKRIVIDDMADIPDIKDNIDLRGIVPLIDDYRLIFQSIVNMKDFGYEARKHVLNNAKILNTDSSANNSRTEVLYMLKAAGVFTPTMIDLSIWKDDAIHIIQQYIRKWLTETYSPKFVPTYTNNVIPSSMNIEWFFNRLVVPNGIFTSENVAQYINNLESQQLTLADLKSLNIIELTHFSGMTAGQALMVKNNL